MGRLVEPGTLIAGKYRVERVLGQGGMGVVVVAMHDELDQRVAIKFLNPKAVADPEWTARFAREARAATRIKSEHAVKVYDVGKLESGAPYMVMEYLEGRDLQTILNDRRRLPVREAVEYLLQACEAIAEAHGAGIVHRDLKPANLFVTHRTDGSPCVKILDFGISKVTSLTGGRDQTVTNTAAIVGSPLYMSPEQMKASKNVDRRTDIWSLGVILQEVVSGLPSFVAETTAELCALVLTAPPTPLRETFPEAPAGLAAIIERCLRKPADERYANIAELAHALEPFGPDSVKVSVERITRLTIGATGRGPGPTGPGPGPHGVGDFAPAPVTPQAKDDAPMSLRQTERIEDSVHLAPTPAPSVTVAPQVEPAAAPVQPAPGAGTAAAWGAPSPVARKTRMPLVIGGSVAAALAVLLVVFVSLKKDPSPAGPTGLHPEQDPASSAKPDKQPPLLSTTDPASTIPIFEPSALPEATTTPTAIIGVSIPKAPASAKPATTASVKKPATPPTVNTTGFGGRN
jgi:eukaryotic-like serine/threonine-protein kinase